MIEYLVILGHLEVDTEEQLTLEEDIKVRAHHNLLVHIVIVPHPSVGELPLLTTLFLLSSHCLPCTPFKPNCGIKSIVVSVMEVVFSLWTFCFIIAQLPKFFYLI